MNVLKRLVQPLRSRKTRVALVTVLAAFAAEFGIGVSQELLLTILGIGTALILGIAHEDSGAKSRINLKPLPLHRFNGESDRKEKDE